jgi:hypothetical protein
VKKQEPKARLKLSKQSIKNLRIKSGVRTGGPNTSGTTGNPTIINC